MIYIGAIYVTHVRNSNKQYVFTLPNFQLYSNSFTGTRSFEPHFQDVNTSASNPWVGLFFFSPETAEEVNANFHFKKFRHVKSTRLKCSEIYPVSSSKAFIDVISMPNCVF